MPPIWRRAAISQNELNNDQAAAKSSAQNCYFFGLLILD
jgi:hypothetical protein